MFMSLHLILECFEKVRLLLLHSGLNVMKELKVVSKAQSGREFV